MVSFETYQPNLVIWRSVVDCSASSFAQLVFEMLAIHAGAAYMNIGLTYVSKMYIFVFVDNLLHLLISGKRENFAPFVLVITFLT